MSDKKRVYSAEEVAKSHEPPTEEPAPRSWSAEDLFPDIAPTQPTTQPQLEGSALQRFTKGASGGLMEGAMDVADAWSGDMGARMRTGERAIGMVKGIFNEPGRFVGEGIEAGKSLLRGDIGDSLYHASGAVPIVGSNLQDIESKIGQGDYAGASGSALNLGATAFPFGRALAGTRAGKLALSEGKQIPGDFIRGARTELETAPKPFSTYGSAVRSLTGGITAHRLGIPIEGDLAFGAAANYGYPAVKGGIKGVMGGIKKRSAERAATANPTSPFNPTPFTPFNSTRAAGAVYPPKSSSVGSVVSGQRTVGKYQPENIKYKPYEEFKAPDVPPPTPKPARATPEWTELSEPTPKSQPSINPVKGELPSGKTPGGPPKPSTRSPQLAKMIEQTRKKRATGQGK